MKLENITPWRERLKWDGERSPSNQARLAAADAEIKELRRALAHADKHLADRLEAARRRVIYWRTITYATQRELDSLKRRRVTRA